MDYKSNALEAMFQISNYLLVEHFCAPPYLGTINVNAVAQRITLI